MTAALKIIPAGTSDLDARAVHEAMLEWESRFGELAGARKITGEGNLLSDLLAGEDDADSYLTSPTYYSFTGRKGLWLYGEPGPFILLGWHPNIPGELLIFPPRGQAGAELLLGLLGHIPEPPRGITLARVKAGSDLSSQATHLIGGAYPREVNLVPVIESVLDWKYPVHVFSTERIANLAGPDFKQVRNRIRQAEKQDIRTEQLSAGNKAALEGFLRRWSSAKASSQDGAAELAFLYRNMLAGIDRPGARLDGTVFYIGNEVAAVTVWDISNVRAPTANRFANLCDGSYVGLSDYVMHNTAETLHAQRIDYMNLGGSEAKGLDDYKRKFMPVCSINLCSVRAVIDDAPFLTHHQRPAIHDKGMRFRL